VRIRPKPDGTIDVDDEAYRVTVLNDGRCEVHRERDHEKIGAFALGAKDEPIDISNEVGHDLALVMAVAKAWAGPKGFVPIQ
jgi:hypothetical protein